MYLALQKINYFLTWNTFELYLMDLAFQKYSPPFTFIHFIIQPIELFYELLNYILSNISVVLFCKSLTLEMHLLPKCLQGKAYIVEKTLSLSLNAIFHSKSFMSLLGGNNLFLLSFHDPFSVSLIGQLPWSIFNL